MKLFRQNTLLFSLSLLAPVLEYGKLWFLDEVRRKGEAEWQEFTKVNFPIFLTNSPKNLIVQFEFTRTSFRIR